MLSLRLLATVSIVALAVTVAVPTVTRSSANSGLTPVKSKGVAASSQRVSRRAKRSIVVQFPLEIEDGAPMDNQLENELSELSDEQLAVLAKVVQKELDRYDPETNVDQYEVVDIPQEYFSPSYEALAEREKRAAMPFEDDEQVVFVPEEAIEEAYAEEALKEATQQQLAKELNEMELRSRISEMANILNERASRGWR